MTPKKSILTIGLFSILLTSCNLYYPVDGKGSQQDHLEIAQKCLTDGDYECAAVEYNAITDTQLKQQKLCTLYITQAGFGLSQFINVFQNANSKVLSKIVNAILPYTATKLAAVEKAKTNCVAFNTTVKAGSSDSDKKLGALLSTISLFTSCAVRMGKTTVGMGTSDSDTTCTTASTSPTTVTAASISSAGNGTISVSQPGMCSEDAVQCARDLSSIDSTALNAAGLPDVATAFAQIPAGAFDTAGGGTPARLGLLQTF